ncbi:MAG: hypothetical protein ACJAZ2_002248 [Glaciecola sp.]|jgi:hypothetical protein
MMNNWITVVSFNFPHDAALAAAKLESEGFMVEVRDEFTIQADVLYSNAIGGIKVMVLEQDYDAAFGVLVEAGFIVVPEKKDTFISIFERITANFPVVGKLNVQLKLIALSALILIATVVPIGVMLVPSDFDIMIDNTWCIEEMHVAGVELNMDSDNCDYQINFDEDGTVEFPGFVDYVYEGRWSEDEGELLISRWSGSNQGYEDSTYVGVYELTFEGNYMGIKSDKVTMIAQSYRTYVFY